MKLWKKMQNPFVLVGQGFLLGGAIFFATHADTLEARDFVPQVSVLATSSSGN